MIKFKTYFDTSHIKKEALENLFSSVCVEREGEEIGYYKLPYEIQAIKDSKEYIEKNYSVIESINTLIIIGIGGSTLGLRAIDTMLSHLECRKSIKLKFLEHTDPIKIEKSLKNVKVAKSLFIVISKSGTTIETISLMKFVLNKFKLLNESNKNRLCIITDKDSKLYMYGKDEQIHTLGINKNIGGRFSVLSTIGILPLSILGYRVENILQGAKDISNNFFQRKEDHILKKAIFYANNSDQLNINILFSYSSIFENFNSWYVQLWGESLGKLNNFGKKISLTPIALIGSIDQHSFLQSIVEGVMDKTVTFMNINQENYKNPKIPDIKIKFLDACDFVNNTSFAFLLQKQQLATMKVVQNQGIPTDHIEIDTLDEKSIGNLIMYYELLTSCTGTVLGINAYNQPGVELGKKILKEEFNNKI